jgi:hypothetical protein
MLARTTLSIREPRLCSSGTPVVTKHFPGMEKDQVRDEREQDKKRNPAAGPHAKRELTDKHKTPGAGTLPEPGKSDDSTSG